MYLSVNLITFPQRQGPCAAELKYDVTLVAALCRISEEAGLPQQVELVCSLLLCRSIILCYSNRTLYAILLSATKCYSLCLHNRHHIEKDVSD
jgi:hypothetical protein